MIMSWISRTCECSLHDTGVPISNALLQALHMGWCFGLCSRQIGVLHCTCSVGIRQTFFMGHQQHPLQPTNTISKVMYQPQLHNVHVVQRGSVEIRLSDVCLHSLIKQSISCYCLEKTTSNMASCKTDSTPQHLSCCSSKHKFKLTKYKSTYHEFVELANAFYTTPAC